MQKHAAASEDMQSKNVGMSPETCNMIHAPSLIYLCYRGGL